MSGLDGVIVADTRLSRIDGEAGRLVVRGRSLEDLARLRFEEVAALLWEDLAPPPDFGPGRVACWCSLSLPAAAGPVEAVQLALCGSAEPASAIPVALAAWNRKRQCLEPLAPSPERGQVEDFLRLYFGEEPDPARVRGLSAYLATVAEHGMNASTFACRVVASTGADLSDAVLAGLCALKGPLHGGAPGPVLDLLDSLEPIDLEGQLRRRVLAGERLMGFGHRIYRTADPRASVLKQAVEGLGGSPRLAFAAAVEEAAQGVLNELKPQRALKTNVEFYTAILLEALGFPRETFTALFAMGRVLGWTAHALEQRQGGRLLRPSANYVGPEPVSATMP